MRNVPEIRISPISAALRRLLRTTVLKRDRCAKSAWRLVCLVDIGRHLVLLPVGR